MRKQNRRSSPLKEVVAERVLQRSDGEEVRILVGRPRRVRKEWLCQFQVLGVGHDQPYDLPGFDSLEALQLALGMMAVQIEAYQRKVGLTFDGGAYLGVFRPDFEAIRKEIRATPEYEKWRHGIESIWK
jgi:hypothetical protein